MKESNFQLLGKPKVTKFSYETNKDYGFKEDLCLEIENNIQIVRNINEEISESFVILNLGIFTGKNFEDVPFKIDMTIEGHFGWDEELESNSSQLETMLKQNAPAILYSYLRPLITIITVEANMPPLVIPLMNFHS